MICKMEECEDPVKSVELCTLHYSRHRRGSRDLYPKETVHHKNGIRDDNRIENLELWASNHPPGQRVSDLLKWAHELIDRYES